MQETSSQINSVYEKERYAEDASLYINDRWKTRKLVPALEMFVRQVRKEEISILDVGGGTGIILSNITTYLEKSHNTKVAKFSLDVSSTLLDIQKQNNPDATIVSGKDITDTPFFDKQIDLSLMLDVLEHVPDPRAALEELRRISQYVVFSLPLDDAPVPKILNYLRKNSDREAARKTVGHVNFYSASTLAQAIQKHCGSILWMRYANVFKHYRESELYGTVSAMDKIKICIAQHMCERSPKFCARLLGDQIIVLAQCY